jgi:hypothetical protein
VRPLYFPDLRDDWRLANNWTTLNRWIHQRGFPPGRMVGRRRVWTDIEIIEWLNSLPAENPKPLKGAAKDSAATKTFGGRRAASRL